MKTKWCCFILLSFILVLSCNPTEPIDENSLIPNQFSKGMLLGTQFDSYEALLKEISIEHKTGLWPKAIVSYEKDGFKVTSILEEGVTEKDFERAKTSGLPSRIKLALRSPYFVMHREDIVRAYIMSRRMEKYFGEGDISFYDIAVAFKNHIVIDDEDQFTDRDFSEKGFINTFNHIIAQVFITAIYSEKLGDFIADSHERARIPELITGEFSEEQIKDLDNGPVDNYVDLINNEWGQEIGKILDDHYSIHRRTEWNEELLSSMLNDIQSFCSWSLGVYFKPFSPEDELVKKYVKKLNTIQVDLSSFMN